MSERRAQRKAKTRRAALAAALALCGALAGCDEGSGATAAGTADALSVLTVAAGRGGSVTVAAGGGNDMVAAGSSRDFAVGANSPTTLEAVPAAGWRFERWALSAAVACAPQSSTCAMAAGTVVADSSAAARFAVTTSALSVFAGPGGSVAVSIGADASVPVAAGSSQRFAVDAETSATLVAAPAAGWRFERWALSSALACAPQSATCAAAVGTLVADSSATARFAVITNALSVFAGPGGSVAVSIGGGTSVPVAAGSSQRFALGAQTSATLVATPAAGWRFERWALSAAVACAPQSATCAMAAGTVVADSSATASFATTTSALSVFAEPGGSVAVSIDGGAGVSVAAGSSRSFTVGFASFAVLEAHPGERHFFVRWDDSGGPACSSQTANRCVLVPGAFAGGGFTAAVFSAPFTWIGPGLVRKDGLSLVAVPYAEGAFAEWQGFPCDGSAATRCDLFAALAAPSVPVAAFHPFVVAGIKSLAFGLGYDGSAGDRFRILREHAPGAGFTALDDAPGFVNNLSAEAGLARISVPVHLLAWGVASYLTEACDALSRCVAANGGERTLPQRGSLAATGYFKAPNAGAGDRFGLSVALGADGDALAVGAPLEDGSATGAFAPADPGWRSAPNSEDSGGAYVYRRDSSGAWALEAFVKAPNSGPEDRFGLSVALSADGATLAVGAPEEDSSAAGAFAPGNPGWLGALDSDAAADSGAAYVYHRSATGRWTVEAFVKAPNSGPEDRFGGTLALSADGATLAVGAPEEDSAAAGAFAPDDPGWLGALDSDAGADSGAAYVYRRDSSGAWALEAFVKAPNSGLEDRFGGALALSADGATLAVGAPEEDSSATSVFEPNDPFWRAAPNSEDSGAAYVYRRAAGRWALDAFVKAWNSEPEDRFGSALALSSDGALLAVGSPGEDSAAAGVFFPADPRWRTTVHNNAGADSGAAYVYRRTPEDPWSPEVFIKASDAGVADAFGAALALSADGTTLAVGASEDSTATGVWTASHPGWRTALAAAGAEDSGGVHVYRRTRLGIWTSEAFVKAPETGVADAFGGALALSGDGEALAVGAPSEDGRANAQPQSGLAAGDETADGAGAVYLY